MNRGLMFREQVAAHLADEGEPGDETVLDVLWTAAVRHVGFGTGFTPTDLDRFHELLWRNLNRFAAEWQDSLNLFAAEWQDSVLVRASVVCLAVMQTRRELGLTTIP